MLTLRGEEAYANLKDGIRSKTFRYPTKEEARYTGQHLRPTIKSSFRLNPGETVFTIGSCFARAIEPRFASLGFDVPVASFTVPQSEFPWPAPHLLNEYNAGTIFQRIDSVYGSFSYSDSAGIERSADGYLDLFLHINQRPINMDRLLRRRKEIFDLYNSIKRSSALIITLGLTECWFDEESRCYLNKAPSRSSVVNQPGRFLFHRMDYNDVVMRLCQSIDLMNSFGKKKILLTVSPVPVEATFTLQDAIIANYQSKSTLRAAAQTIYERFDNVEYFPSYEIAASGGCGSFAGDNVHVTQETVDLIMSVLSQSFIDIRSADAVGNYYPNYIDEEAEDRLGSDL
ncbi:GSCFA domain-containing protein [Methylobacterium sp. E-005]|uniref:GSCFA domain-containing protein n=1 Tax=Methylobacterium sp. E-005 TaxID=2836549 RepID=UPI001FBB680A|nr:GSCFA domain-containing protein [Methylobacterium sp. E-005]MCJ2087484.1 GSCFA domain-containing protein [Methylobacterium sp. E-005]